jgi:hypothetical protein
MLLLGIVTAGTSAAMVYGREALIRQEHYKAAAYILRGMMEQAQGELQYVDEARGDRNLGQLTYPDKPLDLAAERGTSVQRVMVTVSRDVVEEVDDPRNGPRMGNNGQVKPPDFYRLRMHAQWRERDYAENLRDEAGIIREITMETAVLVRADL